jgi:hypothetical protein
VVAQLVERRFRKPKVASSILAHGSLHTTGQIPPSAPRTYFGDEQRTSSIQHRISGTSSMATRNFSWSTRTRVIPAFVRYQREGALSIGSNRALVIMVCEIIAAAVFGATALSARKRKRRLRSQEPRVTPVAPLGDPKSASHSGSCWWWLCVRAWLRWFMGGERSKTRQFTGKTAINSVWLEHMRLRRT